ncbi:uncharacterized protein [Diabrotica undecimpunctata]|uniref:uncharacterized protein n=1 Tax=Diabrotica undecimpunctata TaxID=50387 RepID=UPI003B641727
MAQFCTSDVTAVKVKCPWEKGKNRELIPASVYLPSDATTPPPTKEMEGLVDHCLSQKVELIIGCDSNSQHLGWDSRDNNAQGKSLYDYIIRKDLYILNRGTEPTFINVRSQTVIDITLTTAEISNKIQNWQVSEDTSMSDHRWLTYNISLEKSLIKSRDPKNTDVELYNRLLEDALRNEKASGTNTELERYTVSIQDKISYAYKKSCPIKMVHESQKTNSWWCTQLEHLKKIARTAFNRAKRTKLKEDCDSYQ